MENLTPKQLLDLYKRGFEGAYCDPEELEKLMGCLKKPLFGAAAYSLDSTGAGKLSLPFKSLLKFDPGFGPSEKQETGDCVSHATRNGVDITRAVEIDVKGESESFEGRSATEAIYGSRGHSGQGMSCTRAATYVHDVGGILLRKNYPSLGIDFSSYNAQMGASWGRGGVPPQVSAEGKKHQVKTISLVTTVSEARDALANGYAISVCSGYGFSSRRDSNGIAKRSTGWNHAMVWIACDDTGTIFKEMLFLVQNSWGRWNSGPKRHGQPDGSFWIREKDARGMLAERGAWVFSNVDGFPARDLPDYGTTSYL